MKKNFLIIAILLFSFAILNIPTTAKTLKGAVSLDWDNMSQAEITKNIEEVKAEIFKDNTIYKQDKNTFKTQIKNFVKDNNKKENIILAKSGKANLSDRIIAPFYYEKLFLAYGIIYKNDLRHCYYYTALDGTLFIVETFEKDFNNYPVVSYQYKKKGKLVAGVYTVNKYDQYMFTEKGNFLGRWYGKNYYNAQGKIIMTRDLPKY